MRLYLFTNFFPLKRSEPFLTNEFKITQRYFSSAVIFPLYGELKDKVSTSDNIEVLAPPLISPASKTKLLWNGLLNWAPAHLHAAEIPAKKLWLRPSALYWHLVSLFITRTILRSPSFKKLREYLSQEKNGLLYFYWGDNMCWVLPYVYRHLPHDRVKVIIRLHRTDLYENLKGNHAPLRKKILEYADVVAPVSQHGVDYLKQKYPEFSGKIILSRLGVFDHGLNPASANNSSYTIVSVSSVVPVKRVKLLLSALQKTTIPFQWHHFGDGPLLNEIRQEMLAVPQLKIHLHGFVDNNKIIEFYSLNPVHLFINVSESEGLPVSIMEALSFGIPVLATDAGGTADIIDETVGSLIAVDSSASQIASEIERILVKEKEIYQSKRQAARSRFMKDLSAEKNYREFYELVTGLGN